MGIDGTFFVDIKIKTEEIFINAAEARITFPDTLLQFLGADTSGSTFSFWVEEPAAVEPGFIHFIGGASKGITGESLQVVRLMFKALGIGDAELFVSDAAVTASDGKGTNILSELESVIVSISQTRTPAALPQKEAIVPEEIPKVITRPAISNGHLPEKPEIRVPLYTDETKWYNHIGEIYALWDVHDDVTRIATALDENPRTEPKIVEKELTTGKNFGVPKEGVWYIHVQFKNNVGWGPVAHYRIAIDTAPPSPLAVLMGDTTTDIPNPTLRWSGTDSLSGISHAVVVVDGAEQPETRDSAFTLPPQGPGTHVAKVRLFDMAGNSTEDAIEFEILPLPTPVVESFTTGCFCEDKSFIVSGRTIPDVSVDLVVKDKKGAVAHEKTGVSDISGKWEIIVDEALPVGVYTFAVSIRDERGAMSNPTESQEIRIRPKPLFSIGSFEVSWAELILFLLALAALSRVVFGSAHKGWIKKIIALR